MADWSKGLKYCIYYTGLSNGPVCTSQVYTRRLNWFRPIQLSPWRPTCCFETVKVQILEYLLRAQSYSTVMIHRQREVHQWKTWIRVQAASIEMAGPEMLTGEVPLWPPGFTGSPLSASGSIHRCSLWCEGIVNYAVCLSLQRKSPRSLCVGIYGYLVRKVVSACESTEEQDSLGRLLKDVCQKHCCPCTGEHEMIMSRCKSECTLLDDTNTEVSQVDVVLSQTVSTHETHQFK